MEKEFIELGRIKKKIFLRDWCGGEDYCLKTIDKECHPLNMKGNLSFA